MAQVQLRILPLVVLLLLAFCAAPTAFLGPGRASSPPRHGGPAGGVGVQAALDFESRSGLDSTVGSLAPAALLLAAASLAASAAAKRRRAATACRATTKEHIKALEAMVKKMEKREKKGGWFGLGRKKKDKAPAIYDDMPEDLKELMAETKALSEMVKSLDEASRKPLAFSLPNEEEPRPETQEARVLAEAAETADAAEAKVAREQGEDSLRNYLLGETSEEAPKPRAAEEAPQTAEEEAAPVAEEKEAPVVETEEATGDEELQLLAKGGDLSKEAAVELLDKQNETLEKVLIMAQELEADNKSLKEDLETAQQICYELLGKDEAAKKSSDEAAKKSPAEKSK